MSVLWYTEILNYLGHIIKLPLVKIVFLHWQNWFVSGVQTPEELYGLGLEQDHA